MKKNFGDTRNRGERSRVLEFAGDLATFSMKVLRRFRTVVAMFAAVALGVIALPLMSSASSITLPTTDNPYVLNVDNVNACSGGNHALDTQLNASFTPHTSIDLSADQAFMVNSGTWNSLATVTGTSPVAPFGPYSLTGTVTGQTLNLVFSGVVIDFVVVKGATKENVYWGSSIVSHGNYVPPTGTGGSHWLVCFGSSWPPVPTTTTTTTTVPSTTSTTTTTVPVTTSTTTTTVPSTTSTTTTTVPETTSTTTTTDPSTTSTTTTTVPSTTSTTTTTVPETTSTTTTVPSTTSTTTTTVPVTTSTTSTTTTTVPATTTTTIPTNTTTTVPATTTTVAPTTTTSAPPLSTTTIVVSPPTVPPTVPPVTIPSAAPGTGLGGSAKSSDNGVFLTTSGLILFLGLAGLGLVLRRRRQA